MNRFVLPGDCTQFLGCRLLELLSCGIPEAQDQGV